MGKTESSGQMVVVADAGPLIHLTDDTAARLAAKALNIAASGTIGILLRAMRRGQHDKARTLALLEAIPTQTSLHIRSSLLAQIITEVRSP